MNVAAVNDAPVAVADTLAATEDTPVTYLASDLLGNDTDVESGTLTIASVTSGSNGTAVLNLDGTVTFTPNANFNGVANFTYTTTDGTATSAPATVTVNVAAVNDAAIISGTSTGTVIEASGTSNAILGTPTATGTLTDTDVDNPANTFTAVPAGIASYGTYTMTAGGIWTYTLNNNNATVQALNVGGTLTDTFTVTTADGTPQVVTVTINGANDAPVNTVVTPVNVTEDVATAITNLSVVDVDSPGATITVTLSVPAGTLTANAGGGVTITGSNSDTLVLVGTQTAINAFIAGSNVSAGSGVSYTTAGNASGTVVMTMTSSSSDGALTDIDSITLNITPVNDAPLNTVPVAQTTIEDTSKAITGLAISDVADGNSGSMTVMLEVTNGTLTVTGGTATITSSGTNTVTLTGTVTQINATLAANVTYVPTTSFTGTDTLTMTTNDNGNVGGGALTDVDTVNITITPVNDAPVLADGNTLNYTENALATAIAPSITVTDPDNATLVSGSVSITTNFVAGQDTLAFTNLGMGNIVGTYNGATGVMSLTSVGGTATTAEWQAALQAVTYANSSNAPTTAARTVSFVVNDSALNSNVLTSTVNVIAVNDAPTLTATAANPTFTEAAGSAQAGAVTVFSGAAIGTVEAGQTITGLTFTVSGLLDVASEKILVNGTPITLGANSSGTTLTDGLSYNVAIASGIATITLTGGSMSAAAAQTLVNGITYQNTNIDNPTNGNRVFTLTQIQDSGGTTNGGVDTTALSIVSTVNVNPVNDAPVLDLDGNTTGFNYTTTFFTANGTPIPIVDASRIISDVDGTTLAGATITNTSFSAGDLFVLGTMPTSISATFSGANNRTVNLTGTASLADYQNALSAITFDATAAGGRTINITVTDGTTVSNTAVSAITVSTATATPIASTFGVTGDEDATSIPVTLNATDPNGTINSFRVIALPTNGTLSLTPGGVSIVAGTNYAVTPAQTATLPLFFTPNANYNGAPTFTYLATDNSGATSNTATITITVAAVNDAPTNTMAASYTTIEDTSLNLTGLSVADVDAGNINNITVTLTVSNGAVTATGTGTVGVTGSGTSSVILTGTLANINSYLANAARQPIFVPTSDFNGSVTLTMTTNDGGNTGSGGALIDKDTRTINVTAVTDIVANTATTNEDTPITINVLGNDTFENAGRVITAVNGLPITDGGPAVAVSNGTVALVGGQLVFTPAANFNGTVPTFTYTVTSGGAIETANVNVTVTAVNDAPVNTLPVSYTTDEDTTIQLSRLSITDVDSLGTITVTLAVASGTITASTAGGVTVTGSGGASIQLSGTLVNINAYLANASNQPTYVPVANANGSVVLTMTTSDGALTDVDTININITPVNDAPVLDLDAAAGGTGYTTSFTENGAAVQITKSDLVLTDDGTTLTGATVTLSNWKNGDVLSIGSIPAGISASLSGTNSEILTLTGTASVADYRIALRALSYANTSENPDATARTISIVVNDGSVLSAPAITTVNVLAVNDAPVLDLDGSTAGTGYATYFVRVGAGSAPVAIADIDAVVTDVDSATLTSATVTLTNNQADDVLAVGSLPSGIIASITGNVVTLSGPSSVANYQAALQAITFNNTNAAASTTARTFNVTVNDGSLNSNTATTTVNVVTSSVPIALATTATGNEDASSIPVTLTASDPNGTIESFNVTLLPTNGTLSLTPGGASIVAGTNYPVTSAATASLTLYFTPTTNYSGVPTFTYLATDNSGATSNSATATITVTAVADAPTLSVGNSLTQVFNTTWESQGPLTSTANDTNNATHAKGTDPIEGWSLTTPAVADTVATSGGAQLSQFYFNADGDQILNSNTSTLYTAAGMQGSATGADAQRVFLHLDNASNGTVGSPNYQTPAITRTITVTDVNKVYQLGLNYAPDAAPVANTGFQVVLHKVSDGAVTTNDKIYTYTSAVNQSLVWQAVRTGFNFTATGDYAITIRTTSPETGNGVGGYFDDIRLLEAQGAIQDNYLSPSYGTVTRIFLGGKITAGLVDTDGSETMSVIISNMPGGSRIVIGGTTYSPVNGQVTIPYSSISDTNPSTGPYLMFPEDYSGRVDLGVTAKSTESSNGATATNSQTLTFHVFQAGMASGDPPLVGVVSSTTIVEGDYAVFDIRLNAQLNNDATVVLETINGSATNADYGASLQYSINGGTTWSNYTGSMVMASGTSNILVRTATLIDGSIEGSENFTLKATISSGPTLNTIATGVATILDLDSAPILQVRPVGQWTFDEGFGVPAVNEFRGIIGTLSDANTTNGNASPTWIAGHAGTSGTALQFDGKGASLSVDPIELSPITQNATVTFWIKTAQNQTTDAAQFGGTDIGWNRPSVIGSEQNGAVNDAQWGWIDNAGHIAINVGDTAGAKSATVIANNAWHFVALTRDATTGTTQVWVDGALESTVTANGLKGTITNVFGIGYTNGVNNDFSRNITNDKYLNAGIDDLRIYSNVLSTNQVRSIWETEINHHDVGIANDGGSFQFDVTARAFDTLTVHGLQTGWTLTDGSGGHSVTSTGVTQSIDISTWNLDNPLTVNGVTANQSAMIDVTATKGIHQIDQVLNLVSITSAYEGTPGGDAPTSTANSDFVFGNAGADTLAGLAGDDRLDGGDGNDTLNGGAGSDLLIGGKGNDTLTGGLGADIFAWKLGDAGTIGAPAADTITDFDNSQRSPLGGDVLDLRDLLIGETAGTLLGQDNLSNYLHFEKSGANTVVHVSTNGGYATGFNASLDVQTITLQNVDLIQSFTNDQAIIQDLLTKQKLITD